MPIRCLGYWDYPTNFLVRHGGDLILFDRPFSEELDDYPDEYAVYVLPEMTREQIDADWAGLPDKAVRSLGTVPISAIGFDPTRKASMDGGVLDALFAPAPG